MKSFYDCHFLENLFTNKIHFTLIPPIQMVLKNYYDLKNHHIYFNINNHLLNIFEYQQIYHISV